MADEDFLIQFQTQGVDVVLTDIQRILTLAQQARDALNAVASGATVAGGGATGLATLSTDATNLLGGLKRVQQAAASISGGFGLSKEAAIQLLAQAQNLSTVLGKIELNKIGGAPQFIPNQGQINQSIQTLELLKRVYQDDAAAVAQFNAQIARITTIGLGSTTKITTSLADKNLLTTSLPSSSVQRAFENINVARLQGDTQGLISALLRAEAELQRLTLRGQQFGGETTAALRRVQSAMAEVSAASQRTRLSGLFGGATTDSTALERSLATSVANAQLPSQQSQLRGQLQESITLLQRYGQGFDDSSKRIALYARALDQLNSPIATEIRSLIASRDALLENIRARELLGKQPLATQITSGIQINEQLAATASRAGQPQIAAAAAADQERFNRALQDGQFQLNNWTDRFNHHALRIAEGLVIYQAFGSALQAVRTGFELLAQTQVETVRFERVVGELSPERLTALVSQFGDIAISTNTKLTDIIGSADQFASVLREAGQSGEVAAKGVAKVEQVAGEFSNILGAGANQAQVNTQLAALLQIVGGDTEAFKKLGDQIVVAGRSSSTAIAGILEGLVRVGPNAKAAGIPLDFLAAVLNRLVLTSGRSGDELGNILGTVVAKLTNVKTVEKAFSGISESVVQLHDNVGNLLSPLEILQNFSAAFQAGKFGETTALRVLQGLGQTINPGQLGTNFQLLQAIDEATKRLGGDLAHTNDDAKNLSDALVNTLGGRVGQLQRAFEKLAAVGFARGLKDDIGAVVGLITALTSALSNPLGEAILSAVARFAGLAAIIIGFKFVFDKVAGAVGGVIKSFGGAGTASLSTATQVGTLTLANQDFVISSQAATDAAVVQAGAIAGIGAAASEAAALQIAAVSEQLTLGAAGLGAGSASENLFVPLNAPKPGRNALGQFTKRAEPTLAQETLFGPAFIGEIDHTKNAVAEFRKETAVAATQASGLASRLSSVGGILLGFGARALDFLKGLGRLAAFMIAIQIPGAIADIFGNRNVNGIATGATRLDKGFLSRAITAEQTPFGLTGIGEAASLSFGVPAGTTDEQKKQVEQLAKALLQLNDTGKLTAANQKIMEDQFLNTDGSFKKVGISADDLIQGLLNVQNGLQADGTAAKNVVPNVTDVSAAFNALTASAQRSAVALAISVDLSGHVSTAFARINAQFAAGKLSADEYSQKISSLGAAQDTAAKFAAAYADHLDQIPEIQAAAAASGKTLQEFMFDRLINASPKSFSVMQQYLEFLIKQRDISDQAADSADTLAGAQAKVPGLSGQQTKTSTVIITPHVDNTSLLNESGVTRKAEKAILEGVDRTNQLLANNPITPQINVGPILAQMQFLLKAGSAFGGLFGAFIKQAMGDLQAATGTLPTTATGGGNVGGGFLNIPTQLKDTTTQATQPKQTQIIDIGELRPSQIAQIIAIAASAQRAVVAAGGTVDTKETSALFKGTQFEQLVKGIDQRFLQKAIEQLTEVEKKRLELEQQRLQDVTRNLLVRVGPIQSLVSQPVLSAGGGSLSGQGLNADPRLGNFTINVPINWSGMSLTQLQSFIIRVIGQAWTQAGRGA